MTSYAVVFAPSAVRQLEKLSRHVALRVTNAIDGLVNDPLAGKPLQGQLKGCRSLRVGDYRVIYQVQSRLVQVEIIRIADRREVYR